MQDWDTLPADERRLYARMMEVFAGFLEHTDHHIGRLIDFLESIGELDNTLIMVISDNGASAEGGPTGSVNENKFFNNVPDDLKQNLAAIDDLGGPKYFNHYPWGWTFAGNTPFRRWKRETYRGGVSDPFIVHWPKGIKAKGEIRHQYAHAIDMVPTVLDALGIEAADAHSRRDAVADRGRQLRAHVRRREAPSDAPHAVLRDVRAPLDLSRRLARGVPVPRHVVRRGRRSSASSRSPRTSCASSMRHGWELYNVDEDPAETNNLAGDEPRQADRDDRAVVRRRPASTTCCRSTAAAPLRFADERPQLTKDRKTYVYYPRTQMVPENVAVKVLNRAAQHHRRGGDPEGRRRGRAGLPRQQRRRLHAVRQGQQAALRPQLRRRAGIPRRVRARRCRRAKSTLRYEFEPTGKPDIANGKGTPGRAQLYINGKLVGQADFPFTVPLMLALAAA